MYQINHTKGNLRVTTEQEALERAKEFNQVIITKFDGCDWLLWKDLRDDNKDTFHLTQNCKPLHFRNKEVDLKNTEMGEYWQGSGEGFCWTKNNTLYAFCYGKTCRTIKGKGYIKQPCKFEGRRIILC